MSQNVKLFRAGLAAWNEGDYEAIVELCHPDVEWTFSGRLPDATGNLQGKAAVRRFFETFTKDWSEISVSPDRVADQGSDVVADIVLLAKGRDGIEVAMRFGHVWTFREGELVRFRSFGTFEEALEAVGARDEAAGS
jgi:ketosteroid isomerase-like protein